MVFTCSKQWKHEFVKYVKYTRKQVNKICSKSTIKAQEQHTGRCSGFFIVNFRGVGIEDSVNYLRWSVFCNSRDKS